MNDQIASCDITGPLPRSRQQNFYLFTDRVFKQIASDYGVQIWHSARYTLQMNTVERINRIIEAANCSYISNIRKDLNSDLYGVPEKCV